MMVIHNGIPCSTILQKTRYGQHPFRIVQVSRLYHEIKGQDVLLHAMQHVNKTLGQGSATVDFIGEGESQEFLFKLAQELKVDSWCTFLGKQSRATIYENLQAYDLLVQPSRHEGFGLTVVEAMAARVPVLVSNIEGPMEIIGAGRHGYYFREGDHLDCAAKIIEVVKQSQRDAFPDALDRTAEYVRNQFDIADTARKYLAEYKNIIGETHAA
jgi:glycosyltransferase involved in cell wall biosynthesis